MLFSILTLSYPTYCIRESICCLSVLVRCSFAKPCAFTIGAIVMSKQPSVSRESSCADWKLSIKISLSMTCSLALTLLTIELGFHSDKVSSIALNMLSIPRFISFEFGSLALAASLSSRW